MFRIRDFSGKTPRYSQEQINVLVLEVESEFKWKTAEEAADVYKAFPVQYSTAE
ncbi:MULTISPECIES: hypothetical protein [Bacillus]|uniref:hypothetical protein n=1 Tax=Bacillus TaxID=1386 RepID=UPI002A699BEE|nr:hypothetical protein [Bacillus sonorensis]WPP39269.1 hypothetical protein SK061_24970 [Bacillus sonorensis]